MKKDQKNITVQADLPYVQRKYSYTRVAPQISRDVTLVSDNKKAQTVTVKFDVLSENWKGETQLNSVINQTAGQIITKDNAQEVADLVVPVLLTAKSHTGYRRLIQALLKGMGFNMHDVFDMSYEVQGFGYMGGTGVGEKIHHLVYDLVHGVKSDLASTQVTQLANMYLQAMMDDRNKIHADNKHLSEAIKSEDLVLTFGCRPICQYSVAGYTAIGYPVEGGTKAHISCSKCKKAKYIPVAPNPAPELLAADGTAMKQISKRIDAGKKVTGVTVVTSRNTWNTNNCDAQEKHDDITTFRGGYSLEVTLKFERGGKVGLEHFNTRSTNYKTEVRTTVLDDQADDQAMKLAETVAAFYGVQVKRTDAKMVHVTGVAVYTSRNYFYSSDKDRKVYTHTFQQGINLRVKLLLDGDRGSIDLGNFNTSKRLGEYKHYSYEPALEQEQVAMDLAESVAKSYGVKVTRKAEKENVSEAPVDYTNPDNKYKSQSLWVESDDPRANNNPNQ